MGQSMLACSIVSEVLERTTVPTVLDADALNLMSYLDEQWEVIGERRGNPSDPLPPIIMTPHPSEMSRLSGISLPALLDDFITCAANYAKTTGMIFNAKNTRSVITDGTRAYINPTGTSALAKGGSGDVLTGITAALAAQGCDALTAAALAAYLHGRAAEVVSARMGVRSPLASEIADALGDVFAAFEIP
jgi:NAD(P)H-hydrate epimerase